MSVLIPSFTESETAIDPNAERKARFAEVSRKFINTVVKSSLRKWSPIGVYLAPHDSAPAPAWSNPTSVWFDEACLSFDSFESIASNKGLAVHEMLHILYTPRQGSEIVKFAIDNGYTRELNILEDQRIETLAVGRWGKSARLWLTPTVITHLLDSEEQLAGAFVLTHGRKYLPKDVRKAVQSKFVRPDLMPAIAKVIDQYRLLTFPSDAKVAIDLIKEFHDLLDEVMPSMPKGEPIIVCHGGSTQTSSDVRPMTESEQKRDRDRVAPADDTNDSFPTDAPSNPAPSDSDADQQDGDSSTPEGDSTPTDGTPTESGQGQSQGQPTDDQPKANNSPSSDSTANGNTPAPPTNGSGAGEGDSVADVLRKAISDAVKENRDELLSDSKAINGDTDALNGGKVTTLSNASFEMASVSPESAHASNAFARQLEDLMAKHDSAWNLGVSSGKVNLARWVSGCDFDEAFDRFEVGREDAVDIEAVIVLDLSGSMSGVRTEACEAMWAIKRALDTVNASTTVLTFATSGEVLYSANESATSQLRASRLTGGTNPLSSMRKARNILGESSRAVKVMLTITDGDWGSESEDSEAIIADLRAGGVLTGLINLNMGSYAEEHGFEFVANISEVKGIVSLGRELVETATARNLSR